MKKTISLFLALALVLCLGGCAGKTVKQTETGAVPEQDAAAQAETEVQENAPTEADATAQEDASSSENILTLSDDGITLNGEAVGTDPSAAVYVSNDVIYYEDKDAYDSGNPYGDGEAEDRHTEEEAAATVVVNIAQAGTYRVSGTLSAGQIRVDLGDEARDDPAAVVTLILDNAEITCSVAPAILFLNVYECDGGASAESAGPDVDTSAAGANLIAADGSVNVVRGSHVAKIYKDAADEKKLWKQDGAVYSYVSMNVDGESAGDGVITIVADNEGLDTEMHLTVNGGCLRIFSQDDGINTTEDGISVTTINGGSIHILSGLGTEGDGIDSNGWLVINGGTVISMAHPASDAGLDSDMGSYVNGGTVVALGSTMDWPESDSEQVTVNLQFAARQNAGDAIVVQDTDGNIVFAYDPSEDDVASEYIREYQGAVISCPAFQIGATYQLFLGGTITGPEDNGVYDAAGVTGYDGGTKQVYTGTDVRGMGGRPGSFPGNMPDVPDGWQPSENGQMPGGGQPPENGQMPGGGQPPENGQVPGGGQPPENGQMPGGGQPSENGQMPDGGQMPENGQTPGGGDIPGFPGSDSGEIVDIGEPSGAFYMQDKVNGFSGIRAE